MPPSVSVCSTMPRIRAARCRVGRLLAEFRAGDQESTCHPEARSDEGSALMRSTCRFLASLGMTGINRLRQPDQPSTQRLQLRIELLLLGVELRACVGDTLVSVGAQIGDPSFDRRRLLVDETIDAGAHLGLGGCDLSTGDAPQLIGKASATLISPLATLAKRLDDRK